LFLGNKIPSLVAVFVDSIVILIFIGNVIFSISRRIVYLPVHDWFLRVSSCNACAIFWALSIAKNGFALGAMIVMTIIGILFCKLKRR
jgi:hypothetical protein